MSTHALAIDLVVRSRLCLAMQQSGVRPVVQVRVQNTSPLPLRDLRILLEMEPDLAEPWEVRVESLGVGESHLIREPAVALRPGPLATQRERKRGTLRVTATGIAVQSPLQGEASTSPEVVTRSAERELELLSPEEWPGASTPPSLLAAFVLPNDPGVAHLLRQAADLLGEWTGNPALDGYQSGDAKRVRLAAAAVYAAVQRLDVTYVVAPASFEKDGQKLRSPSRVLSERLGNCIDAALLCAAALEQAGLHPLVFLVQGHAFCGVWLTPQGALPSSHSEEARRFLSLLDLGEIATFDATAATTRPLLSFEDAERLARQHLENTTTFEAGVDIAVARAHQVLPLASIDEHSARLQQLALSEQRATTSHAPGSAEAIALRERASLAGAGEAAQRYDGAAARLLRWRKGLLDLTLNNRLLNHRDGQRWIALEAKASAVQGALTARGALTLAPKSPPAAGTAPEPTEATRVAEQALEAGRALTGHPAGDLEKRGVALARAARLAEEEGGATSLFLTMGFLHWFEAESSQRELLAPVVLWPMTLTREAGSRSLRLSAGDAPPFLNPSLVEKLKADLGIDLTPLERHLDPEAEVDLPLILHRAREVVAGQSRWLIRETCGLGLFSFAKFLMYHDLAASAGQLLTSDVARAIVDGQPYGARTSDLDRGPGSIPKAELPAAQAFCPLDADASQLAAVAAASRGASFVLQGPPGTGKSQTITNMIAQLLAEGKRVLFVSEKMAALDVVYRRLSAAGLGPFCLELHSRESTRRKVLDQLALAMEMAGTSSESGWEEHAAALGKRRAALDAYALEVGRERPPGWSFYQALGLLMRLRDVPPAPLSWADHPEQFSKERYAGLLDAVERWEAILRVVGPPRAHSLAAVTHVHWTPTLAPTLSRHCAALRDQLDRVRSAWGHLAAQAGLDGAPREDLCQWWADATLLLDAPQLKADALQDRDWPARAEGLRALADAVEARQNAWSTLRPRWRPEAPARVDAGWAAVLRKPWWWLLLLVTLFAWWRARAQTRALLAPGQSPAPAADLARDIDAMVRLRALDADVDARAAALSAQLPDAWQGLETSPEALRAFVDAVESARGLRRSAYALPAAAARGTVDVLERLAVDPDQRDVLREAMEAFARAWRGWRDAVESVAGVLRWETPKQEGGDFCAAQADILERVAAASPASLRDWSQHLDGRQRLAQLGLSALVQHVAEGAVDLRHTVQSFEHGFAAWWVQQVMDRTPELSGFRRLEHEHHIVTFRTMDRASMALATQEVRARLASALPSPQAPRATGSELATLLHQLQKQRNHLPIRRLLLELPTLVPLLKPCFLMSPLSIAQYLDPKLPPFDVVIFDEASQIPSADGIGAIGRGKQVIVVGDTKQLPPTSFFQRADQEDFCDEEDIEELESILNECLAAGVPEMYLRWHYRSNDESLIAFSNANYYDHRLITFPSAGSTTDDQGVRLMQVQGTYARGGARTNRVEAEAVVAEVVRRLRDPILSKESLGVITFSLPQQTLIEDLLDRARREHPEIEPHFSSERIEPVFVKNLETVQGDERDSILFSICYGPDEHGRVAMNFGPLNRDGGERRLNVAVTRARTRLLVFSSLDPDQMDLRRTDAIGVAHLKLFLEYAAHGARALGLAHHVGGTFDSPFEEEVFTALRRRGWDVDTQVGCSGYRIDLAVRHPHFRGRYVLGIECDGATYHRTTSARERDRLRQQVLEEKMGWRIHRIWSTDWWVDREGETERAVTAIEDALRLGQVSRGTVDPEAAPGEGAAGAAGSQSASPASNSSDDARVGAEDDERRRRVVERYADAPKLSDAALALPGAHPWRAAALPPRGDQGPAAWRALRPAEQQAMVREVAEVEAPLTLRALARRVLDTFGIARVSAQLLGETLVAARSAGLHVDGDEVVWLSAEQAASFTLFRPAQGDERPRAIDEIPLAELRAALVAVARHAGRIEQDALLRETLRLFGYASLTTPARERLDAALAAGVDAGLLRVEGEVVTPA